MGRIIRLPPCVAVFAFDVACYHPIRAYYSDKRNPSGKRSIVFNPTHGYVDLPVVIPCGQCIGCRLERSRQWAIRCVHEASLHEDNSFITLTYNDESLPWCRSICKTAVQKFWKRLRKQVGVRIRYFMCGEYGDKLSRPHYHACVFGYDFPDKEVWRVRDGVKLYRSPLLESLWTKGFSTVGAVTFESAAYVARYILKKVTGKGASAHYVSKLPEATWMSRRPGIGKAWFEKFSSDVYPSDEVVLKGSIKCRPPKYYDYLFDIDSPEEYRVVKTKRIKAAIANAEAGSRLPVKERCKLRKSRLLRRGYEG